jgi:hypothetical protein
MKFFQPSDAELETLFEKLDELAAKEC